MLYYTVFFKIVLVKELGDKSSLVLLESANICSFLILGNLKSDPLILCTGLVLALDLKLGESLLPKFSSSLC